MVIKKEKLIDLIWKWCSDILIRYWAKKKSKSEDICVSIFFSMISTNHFYLLHIINVWHHWKKNEVWLFFPPPRKACHQHECLSWKLSYLRYRILWYIYIKRLRHTMSPQKKRNLELLQTFFAKILKVKWEVVIHKILKL